MKYVASVSFGKDSTAMLLMLIEKQWPLDEVVFYNTGMEFDAVYRIRDQLLPVLKEHNIKFVELHPRRPFLFDMFDRKIKYRNKPGYHYGFSWCGGRCRWHTRNKQQAIKEYKQTINDDVVDYIGIAADEIPRISKNSEHGKRLPLVEFGMTEAMCLEFCISRGYRWIEYDSSGNEIDLYHILDRVSCWCCSNKNLKELRNIYNLLPKYWNRLKFLQKRTERPMKSYGSVFELEERFAQENKEGCNHGK